MKSHEEGCTFSPEKSKKEVLNLLPTYEKAGESDIETPCISLLTSLYDKYPDVMTKVLLKESPKLFSISEENLFSNKKKINKKGNVDCGQLKIDRFFKPSNN